MSCDDCVIRGEKKQCRSGAVSVLCAHTGPAEMLQDLLDVRNPL